MTFIKCILEEVEPQEIWEDEYIASLYLQSLTKCLQQPVIDATLQCVIGSVGGVDSNALFQAAGNDSVLRGEGKHIHTYSDNSVFS